MKTKVSETINPGYTRIWRKLKEICFIYGKTQSSATNVQTNL